MSLREYSCPECPGELTYQEQTKDARGNFASRYKCERCGYETHVS